MNTSAHGASLLLEIGAPENSERLALDFAVLRLSYEVAHGLKRALWAEMGHNLPVTLSKGFFALRLLAQHLHERGEADLRPLPIDLASNFANWLDQSQRGPSAQAALNTTCRLLEWCQRNVTGIVSPNATFWLRTIRDTTNPQRVSADPDLKPILAACYDQIAAIEQRMANGRRLIAGRDLSEGERPLSDLIRELLALGDGVLPKQRLVNRSGNSLARRIEDQNGYRALARLIWPCPEDIFPFYLAILAQTSGNPDAIKALSRQCIHQHPLRSDLERLQWIKKRGATEQHVDFPAGRNWSAPSLVRRLISLNEELVSRCVRRDVGKLFICYSPNFRTARVPDINHLISELDAFVKRNGFATFQFRDLRHAGARAHHQAAGTILAAKHRLNHNSIASTLRYTTLQDRATEHDLLIRQFQGEIVRLSTRPPIAAASSVLTPSSSRSADTVFGFSCKDPLAGILPGSAKGKTCLQFSRCATCPGALIVLDDANVVARLIATSTALEDARKRSIAEGWWPRFELLYEPTHHILTTQILPAVPASVRVKVTAIDIRRLIPILE